MSWIESHQELRHHPKLSHVCRALESDPAQIVGNLHFLWWWCVDYALNGDLSRFSNDQIADAAGWRGDADRFVKALEDARFLDGVPGSYRVHDWLDFCGDLVKKRLEYLGAKKGRTSAILGDSLRNAGVSQPTIPHPTLPNQTNKKEAGVIDPKPAAPAPDRFEQIWNRYPRREGKKEAERHFKASVKTDKDWLDIQNALDNYVTQIRVNRTEMQFTKQGATWFNNWRDYVDYKVNGEEVNRPKPLPPKPKPVETELSDADRAEAVRVFEAAKAKLRGGAKPVPVPQ